MCFSSLTAATLNFRLPVIWDDIHISILEFLDPEYIGVAGRITFLSHLEAEICLGVFIPPFTAHVTFFRSRDEG